MKKIIILSTFFSIIIAGVGMAQSLNWRNLEKGNLHIINVNAGWDYGMTAGLGYGRKLPIKLPLVLNVDYSAPFGEKVFDDFKARLGGQAELYRWRNFSVSAKMNAVFRRYQDEMAQLSSFGSEFSTTVGYYKPKWFAAGEFGFDKAIATHIRNSDIMKANYPGIKNGWYVPTAGNFFFGILTGYSFRNNDLYLRAGKEMTQHGKESNSLPVYLQLGFNMKFSS
jgi:hypothetical protein